MVRLLRRLRVLAQAVTLPFLLAACGSDGSNSTGTGGGGSGGTGGTGGGQALCAQPGAWTHTDVPDTTGVVSTALALDPNGLPRVAYVSVNTLRYAAPADASLSAWVDEKIASSPAATKVSGLLQSTRPVLDGDTVHIVFDENQITSPNGHPLTHALRVGGAWALEDLGQGSVWSEGLALAPNGELHLAYGNAGGLIYRSRIAGAWSAAEVVESSKVTGGTVGTGGFAALFLRAGVSDIYFTNANDTVRRASGQPGTWTIDELFGDVDLASSNETLAIAVDPTGNAHFLVPGGPREALWHVSNESGSWVTTELYPERDPKKPVRFWAPSMVSDAQGGLHAIAQPDDCAGVLYLSRVGTEWKREVIDPDPRAGGAASIAVGADGRPRVSYRADGQLRIAVRD